MVSISSQNIQTIAQHEIKQKLQVVEEVSSTSVFNLLVNISVCYMSPCLKQLTVVFFGSMCMCIVL